jgi:hypothetical protein
MKVLSLCASLLLCLMTVSCAPYQSAAYLGWSRLDAEGLQPVQEKPPTIGWKRLKAHANVNDAVKLFLQSKGMPDFLVEKTGLLGDTSLCLFYDRKNEAWMLEYHTVHTTRIKVLGPAPIGEKDRRLFQALREVDAAAAAYGQP